jgi:serine/threonine protein kinase
MTSLIFGQSCQCLEQDTATTARQFERLQSGPEEVLGNDLYRQPAAATSTRCPNFGGRYEVLDFLGEGGMGTVYKVRESHTQKSFAIKVLKDDLAADETALMRFNQEVAAASELEHPNLVFVYGVNQTSDGAPYMVMNYVEGRSLAALLRETGPLQYEQALNIFVQVAKALEHAHSKGLVHRDLKPSNIIISSGDKGREEVRVVDFGIAKVVNGLKETSNLTQTGELFGTPLYMSPEQCLGEDLDARSDLYSFGCVMYETLCGRPPFADDNAVKTMMRHLQDKPPPMRLVNPQLRIPRDLGRTIMACLKKNPADRYQSAKDLLTDLEGAQIGRNFSGPDTASEILTRIAKNRPLLKSSFLSFLAGLAFAVPAALVLSHGFQTREIVLAGAPQEFQTAFTCQIPIFIDSPPLPKTSPPRKPIVVSECPSVHEPILPPLHLNQVTVSYGKPLTEQEKIGIQSQLQKIAATHDVLYSDSIAQNVAGIGLRAIPYIVEKLGSDDQKLAEAAFSTILRLYDRYPVATVNALKSNQKVDGYVDSLLRKRDSQTMRYFDSWLSDDDPLVRNRALLILQNCFQPRAYYDPFIRMPTYPAEQTTNMIVRLMLKDNDENVRIHAAEELLFAFPGEQVIQSLEFVALNDKSEALRCAAADSLFGAVLKLSPPYGSEPLQVLGYLLQRGPENWRVSTLGTLAGRNMPGHSRSWQVDPHLSQLNPLLLPYVRPLLKDKSLLIRNLTLDVITRSNDVGCEALPDVVQALDDPSTRTSALSAISRYGPRARCVIPKLLALKMDPSTNAAYADATLAKLIAESPPKDFNFR